MYNWPSFYLSNFYIIFYLSNCPTIYILYVYLSICLSVQLSICLPVQLPICFHVHLSYYLHVHLSSCPYVYQFNCPYVYQFNCPCVYLSDYLSKWIRTHMSSFPRVSYPYVYLSICPPNYLSTIQDVELTTCQRVYCPPVLNSTCFFHMSTCQYVHLTTCPPFKMFKMLNWLLVNVYIAHLSMPTCLQFHVFPIYMPTSVYLSSYLFICCPVSPETDAHLLIICLPLRPFNNLWDNFHPPSSIRLPATACIFTRPYVSDHVIEQLTVVFRCRLRIPYTEP